MKIGFYSTVNGLPWGGSEALWSRAALLLQKRGHHVAVNYKWWPACPKRLAAIQAHGGTIFWRDPPAPRLVDKAKSLAQRALRVAELHPWVFTATPDFVLITVGYHTDDLSVAQACQRYGIPYAINLQCADANQWITRHTLSVVRTAYLKAERCFFLSEENRQIMEQQLAAPIERAEVADNPLAVRPARPLRWPAGAPPWRLACVGRLHFRSKGQDLILEVLRRKRWRERPVEVVFYGEDQGNAQHIKDLARRYGLEETVRLGGFRAAEAIWRESHALLLPSRYEGMPMVTAEALFCGRPAIVTPHGRNAALVDDGATGFLAEAATAGHLAAALERAWQRREEWSQMGRLGAERVRRRYRRHPAAGFADRLEQLAH